MAINPAQKSEALNSPTERASQLNDPQFENQQGYFPYDLTHTEYISPLFGQITPTMHLDTVPGDRTVVHDNVKTILNQINGNLLSTVNQYVDSFYVPLRSVFPTNYEKLIPNPVKGDDLPNSALPQVPFGAFIMDYIRGAYGLEVAGKGVVNLEDVAIALKEYAFSDDFTSLDDIDTSIVAAYLARLTLLATVLSRGQLLDYLGIAFDSVSDVSGKTSGLQDEIDKFFDALYNEREQYLSASFLQSIELDLATNEVDFSSILDSYKVATKSEWRSAFADIFEKGHLPILTFPSYRSLTETLKAAGNLISWLEIIFSDAIIEYSDKATYLQTVIDEESNPFGNGHFINLGKILAYQQVVAHYFTNDSVDNIFSSDLFMQLLRSIMFPMDGNGFTREPVFDYNGVATEYDYISCGAFFNSLLTDTVSPQLNRQYIWLTVMMLLRRSLRYGDYFSTARPNMLAIGQLSIPTDTDGNVSPIDVTKNLLMQRYLNAANSIGRGFLQFMSSVYGVKPSDTGCIPRFVSHRKIELENRVTTNTASDQGAQTTNLVGFADNNAFDVFIDDLGYLISVTSYDVLPVYSSGVENTYHFADRFDYFNPMLQGIGDQPIRGSELIGDPVTYNHVFGYTMRNAEYKYKLSKAHGAFVNSLPGYLLKYPLQLYRTNFEEMDTRINPDYIRDKPAYIDSMCPELTGTSPATYYHFICACNNQVLCARKIQATPGVLF